MRGLSPQRSAKRPSLSSSVVQPYNQCIDFETGLPDSMITIVDEFEAVSGRAVVTDTFPFRGDYAFNLDSSISGIAFTQQAGVLLVDLEGQTDVELNFWVREHRDENHPQDGVFVSDDNGATYNPNPKSQRLLLQRLHQCANRLG